MITVQLTPTVYRLYSRTEGVERRINHHPHYAPAAHEFDFCRNFVITVSLRVAELEAYLVPPSWERAQDAP